MNATIDPGVRIGHVHLKVADLQRALDFYCGVLGFEVTLRYGTEAAFLAAGGYHHHIGLTVPFSNLVSDTRNPCRFAPALAASASIARRRQ
jgi:catechol-2,3-dioxygenase